MNTGLSIGERLRRTEPRGIIIVVMGVAGSGKSTVAEHLAALIGASFKDGDQLHPPANIEKMSSGRPLSDEDRKPWLEAVRNDSARQAHENGLHVVACSALKKGYRDILNGAADRSDADIDPGATGVGRVAYVFLEGSRDLIASRMGERKGHFMPTALLDSQFDALDVPSGERDVVTVGIEPPPATIALAAATALDILFARADSSASPPVP